MLTRSQSSRVSRRVSTPRTREISPISHYEGSDVEAEQSPAPGPSTADKGKGRAITPEEDSTLPQQSQSHTDALLQLVQQLGNQAAHDREQAARDREQAALDRRTLNDALLAQPQATTTTTDTAAKTIHRKLVDPARFCGGARDLDRFLTQIRRRFETHPQQFQNEADQVDYALSLLGKWSSNEDTELKTTKMTNPTDWGSSLISSKNPCLANFDLFEKEIRQMYADREWRFKAAGKAISDYAQGQSPADAKETVRDFANRVRTNWREAGWDEAKREDLLYDIAWAGLRPVIKARIKPLADEETGRFDTIDQLFNKAAASETNYVPKQPENQNQNQQNQQQNAGKGRGKRGKGGQQDQSNNPVPNTQKNPQGQSSNANANTQSNQKSTLPPSPWVPTEVFTKRKDAKQCTRCGSDGHFFKTCTKYGPPTKADRDKHLEKKPKLTPKDEAKN
jgi:hypothetical protein